MISAQSGKSEAIIDIIGERLWSAPVPILYTGPSKQFLQEQWEPRIVDLLDNTALSRLAAPKSRQRKTLKTVSGVPLRLAHAGSSTALKSDPFGLCLTDEVDELLKNVKGAGNPIQLVDARGDTHPDFVHLAVSTPSEGVVETEFDDDARLEFWSESDPDTVQSAIWRMWQGGTRYHWAWPCPHCGEYFIPRFACLEWDKPLGPDGREQPSTPSMARSTARLVCPNNGCIIEDDEDGTVKKGMNARGVYVAPGQRVDEDGVVHGTPPDSWTLSYWVSGLASPFVSWGERAARYVEAVRGGDPETIKVVKNAGFGELYTPGGGSAPDWAEVAECAADYQMGEVLPEVKVLTLTADVQKDRIYYVIRGWGAVATSWLIKAEELYGNTAELEIWNAFANVVTQTYDGMPIRLALVDSGFRPGKPFIVPEHRVYEFARRFPSLVYATKGSSTQMRKPITLSKIDVTLNGKEYKNGLDLMRIDTDVTKSWVQQRVRWEKGAPGAWYLPNDISDDYCRQIVSEARIRGPGGKPKWVARSKENHYLDCEAMQAAAQILLNIHTLRDDSVVRRRTATQQQAPAQPQPAQPVRKRKAEWLRNESIW